MKSPVDFDTCANFFLNYFYQDGIQPMWEDDRNRRGGRWLVNLNKQQRNSDLDNFWLETVSINIICVIC